MSSRPGTSKQLLEQLAPYFHESETSCPYGLPRRAIYRVAGFPRIPQEVMGALLAAGYRRNGNNIYTMLCPGCQGCRPTRLDPRLFTPNRNQRRALRKNQDLAIELEPLAPDQGKITLLQKFFDQRFPERHNSATDYYAGFFLNSSEFTLEIKYLQGKKLVGISIVDVGTTWLNAVYFFFDPAESRRSPGIFNILQLISLCREHDLEHLYLGYAITEVSAMRYKSGFLPQQVMVNGVWQTVPAPHQVQPGNLL